MAQTEPAPKHNYSGRSSGTAMEGAQFLRYGEASKRLESAVLNHVSLGQFEAAGSILAVLAKQPGMKEVTQELLKIIILESANYWSESASVPSPHHLSWLAIDTYKDLFPNELDQLPEYVEKLVEFRLLLYVARNVKSFSSHVASWLCRYHAIHVLQIPGANPEAVPSFPPLSLSFLKDVFLSCDPTLGHAVVSSLTVRDNPSQYLSSNETLQSLYVDCIEECLKQLEELTLSETDSSYDSQYESDYVGAGPGSIHKRALRVEKMVYDLLSLVDPSPDMTKLTQRIHRLFHSLLQTSYGAVCFEPTKIYSCLLGRSTTFLLSRLHEVEEFIRMKAVPSDVSSQSSTTALEAGTRHVEADSQGKWKALFFGTIYDQKHLLENAVESGIQMICQGKLDELSQLLSQPIHTPLRPILLLLGWDKYPSSSIGKNLLETLWPSEVSANQSLLFSGCCKLAFQVELVQWCLEKARPHVVLPQQQQQQQQQHLSSSTTSSSSTKNNNSPSSLTHTHTHTHTHVHPLHTGAGEVFKGLEAHSTLYVLHHFTPLASLDPDEVVEILRIRPRVPSLALTRASPIHVPFSPYFSRGNTPLKPAASSTASSTSDKGEAPPLVPPLSSPTSAPSASSPALTGTRPAMTLKPEQRRDIAVFRGFCLMKRVMDAVWVASLLSNGIVPPLPATAAAAAAVTAATTGSGSGAERKVKADVLMDVTSASASTNSPPLSSLPSLPSLSPPLSDNARKPAMKSARKLELGGGGGGGTADTVDGSEKHDILAAGIGDEEDARFNSKLYQKLVLSELDFAKKALSSLYPLNFRLEILENIFSLLFLTNKDIRHHETEPKDNDAFLPHASSAPVTEVPHTLEGSCSSSLLSSIAMFRNKSGFLLNEKAVGDMIDFLQDCLFELASARFALINQSVDRSPRVGGKGGGRGGRERRGDQGLLQSSEIRSSISSSALQQRSMRLNQYVNEAKWRLQLVNTKQGVQVTSPLRKEAAGSEEKGLETSSTSTSLSEWSESEENWQEAVQNEKAKRRKKGHIDLSTREKDLDLLQKQPKLSASESAQAQAGVDAGSGNVGGSGKPDASLSVGPPRSRPTVAGISPGVSPVQQAGSSPIPSSSSTLPPAPSPSVKPSPVLLDPRGTSVLKRDVLGASEKYGRVFPDQKMLKKKSEDSGECADVEEKDPCVTSNRKKRLRSRSLQVSLAKRRRRRLSEMTESTRAQSNIVSTMLASPNCLLRLCLRHLNYLRANEVLKMFNMEGQLGEVLVHFAEQYELVSQELHQKPIPAGSSSLGHKASTSGTVGETELPSLLRAARHPPHSSAAAVASRSYHQPSSLQFAIRQATTSSVAMESLNKLLAPSSTNKILFSGDEQLEKAAMDIPLLQQLRENVVSLVMLDMVCSNELDGLLAKRIIEQAISRLPNSILHSQKGPKALKRMGNERSLVSQLKTGPFTILNTFSEVSGCFGFATDVRHCFSSPHSLLMLYSHQLQVAYIFRMRGFLQSYRNAREKLDHLLSIEVMKEQDVVDEIVRSRSNSPEPLYQPAQQHLPVASVFNELLNALQSRPPLLPHSHSHSPMSPTGTASGSSGGSGGLPTCKSSPSLMRRSSVLEKLQMAAIDEPSDEALSRTSSSFVVHFSNYLTKLVALLMKLLHHKSISEDTSFVTTVLRESPTHLLGRLVFEKHIKPQRLEELMKDFGHLNVVEVLMKCCCPQLPSAGAMATTGEY